MRAAAILLVLGGCDAMFNLDHLHAPDPESDVDAALGVLIDAQASCTGGDFYGQYGIENAGLMKICVPTVVPPSIMLTGDIDTNGTFCDATFEIDSYHTEVCVKWAASIAVSAIRATGARPLVLVAPDDIVVSGVVDIASHSTGGGERGAGANWAGCPANNGPANLGGGGGGAGGSFSTRGGNGGANGSGSFTAGRPPAPLDRVRGGCEGGNGGDGPLTGGAGLGGRAGGAIYLIAGKVIELEATAVINASGQGGRGGMGAGLTYVGGGGAGGGGGSGGLIGLDSPMIMIDGAAKVFANGGGGGGAGGQTDGGAGADPKAGAITSVAPGGTGSTYGGKGGAGAMVTANAGSGVNGKAGGGGGGATGFIAIFTRGAPVTTGQFSPAPVSLAGQPQ